MHLIPFKGKSNSGAYKLNLLFNEGKIYIMDNHLAASWCWLQKIDYSKQYNLLHIDRHYDLLNSQTDWWVEEMGRQNINIRDNSIEEILSLTYNHADMPTRDRFPVFRWDNYITILNRLYPNLLSACLFATQNDGDIIDELEISEVTPWDLQENLSYWLTEGSNGNKWIVNLDIDYFFCDNNDKYFQLFDDAFVKRIAEEIKASLKNVEVLTIALSPELCGGWDEAERIAKIFIDKLKIQWPY